MGIELDEESFRAGQSGFENHKCLKYEYNKMLEKYTLLGDVTVFPVTQNNIEQVRRQKKNKLEGGTAIVQSRQELQINVEMLTQ